MMHRFRKKSLFYLQSSAVISIDVSVDMQLVKCSFVANVEEPVFRREPQVSRLLLPFQAKTVASTKVPVSRDLWHWPWPCRILLPFQAKTVVAWRRQKVNPLQTQPEVLCPICSLTILYYEVISKISNLSVSARSHHWQCWNRIRSCSHSTSGASQTRSVNSDSSRWPSLRWKALELMLESEQRGSRSRTSPQNLSFTFG